jgi:hypothetical protein
MLFFSQVNHSVCVYVFFKLYGDEAHVHSEQRHLQSVCCENESQATRRPTLEFIKKTRKCIKKRLADTSRLSTQRFVKLTFKFTHGCDPSRRYKD